MRERIIGLRPRRVVAASDWIAGFGRAVGFSSAVGIGWVAALGWATGCGGAPTPRPDSSEPAPIALVAHEAPELSATLASCEPLVYADEGADPDRGPHVRAASGLALRPDGRMVVAQDDMAFLVTRDSGGALRAHPLPARNGRRRFEEALGNKADKPDLEACTAWDADVFAFGSGTHPGRSWIARLDARETVHWRDADALYAPLRSHPLLAGQELNIEGAVRQGDRLWLLHRGNGTGRPAIFELAAPEFLAWFEGRGAVPGARARLVDLGAIDGVPFGFTDATHGPAESLLFLAGAEDSASVLEDGRVAGVRAGFIVGDRAVFVPIQDAEGRPVTEKLEGVALDPADPTRAWVVTDVDDTEIPANLCQLRLGGPWQRLTASGEPSNG